ncbi:MAG: bacteriocin fulvocin C-related protein [Bacteroidetes bacterium]|nr:bacteriocin fulvocin C-related protein [Bacteroidota bacterium]MCA6443053.1 bacteriocin fulvocin C-related protein [Bacteroidota bacterium]
MKKTIKTFGILALASLLVISCKKAKVNTPVSNEIKNDKYDFRKDDKLLAFKDINISNHTQRKYENVDMAMIEAIYELTPSTNRNAAFSLLSNFEKYAYWDNLITRKIESSSLTSQQKSLLVDFKNLIIIPQIYTNSDEGNDLRTGLENSLSDIFIQFIDEGIDTTSVLNIFYANGLNNLTFTDHQVGGVDWGHDCGCNRGSVVNGWKNRLCVDAACNVSSFGCGFVGAFMCNGRPAIATSGGGVQFLDMP